MYNNLHTFWKSNSVNCDWTSSCTIFNTGHQRLEPLLLHCFCSIKSSINSVSQENNHSFLNFFIWKKKNFLIANNSANIMSWKLFICFFFLAYWQKKLFLFYCWYTLSDLHNSFWQCLKFTWDQDIQ